MNNFGTMLSFIIKGDIKNSIKFLQSTKIFVLAESLGCVESLVELPALMTHASVAKEIREELGIFDTFIRIRVGSENC